jgi:hypothetical protein
MATTEMSFTPEDVRLMWNELVALRQILRQEKKQKDDVYNHLVLNDAMITILQESQPVTDVSSPFSPAPAHSQQAEPSDSEIEMEETVEPAEEAPFTLVQGKPRKRPTPELAPMAQAAKSGPSGEPSQARAPKKPKLPTPEVPQTQTTRPAPVKPVTQL